MTTPDRDGSKPRMRPTDPAMLAVTALVAAAVAWLLISSNYGSIPRLPWVPPTFLLCLAIVDGILAPGIRARIEHRPGTAPVNPLVAARLVVLAKTSALAGALFGGLYAGFTLWLVTELGTLRQVSDDLPQAALGLFGSAALVVTGLALERACRVPEDSSPDDEESTGDDESAPEVL
jgi:uncharacterized membrane protein